jgi:predicted Zn-dependent peptidase
MSLPRSDFVHPLANGLTLVAEPMPWLKSAAFTLLLPAGTYREPLGMEGLCAMTLEMVQRGAADRSSRQVIEALDQMGIERSCSASTFHSSFSATMVADKLIPTLSLYADMVRRPHLPEDELEESRHTAMQELLSLDDDPYQRIFTELKKLRFSPIHGRSPYGSRDGIENVQHKSVTEFWRNNYVPNGAVLAVAGHFDWTTLLEEIERQFGDWKPGKAIPREPVQATPQVKHIEHDSSQTHIALAYDCVPYPHPEFYQSRGLISVLSDGMSSRLFTEVREKRGLVYSVSSSAQTIGESGSVLTYAGTTAERSQETLDVTVATIQSLGQGIDEGELGRLKARVKSSLIMDQESSASRSSQIASDWHYLKRIVPRQEVMAKIEALSCASLLKHFQEYPPSGWSLVSLGPKSVELPHGI